MTLVRSIEVVKLGNKADEVLSPWRAQLKRAGIYFDIRDAIIMAMDRIEQDASRTYTDQSPETECSSYRDA